jgi:uncharacterized membrane protein
VGRQTLSLAAPLHAIFVHFSIALTSASVAFDVAAAFLGQRMLAEAGWWTLAASTAITVGTIATGISSRLRLPMEEGPARAYLRSHMALGPIVFGLLLAMTVWRAELWERGRMTPWAYIVAAVALLLALAVQGYLGGELVYRFGANVRSRFRRLPSEPQSTDSSLYQKPV